MPAKGNMARSEPLVTVPGATIALNANNARVAIQIHENSPTVENRRDSCDCRVPTFVSEVQGHLDPRGHPATTICRLVEYTVTAARIIAPSKTDCHESSRLRNVVTTLICVRSRAPSKQADKGTTPAEKTCAADDRRRNARQRIVLAGVGVSQCQPAPSEVSRSGGEQRAAHMRGEQHSARPDPRHPRGLSS